jgi:hypothetical protein
VLNTRVLSLGVFTNENSVDIVVGGLVSLDRNTWPNVGEQVEGSAQGEVEGNVALADLNAMLDPRMNIL